jgi:hypothetical protein
MRVEMGSRLGTERIHGCLDAALPLSDCDGGDGDDGDVVQCFSDVSFTREQMQIMVSQLLRDDYDYDYAVMGLRRHQLPCFAHPVACRLTGQLALEPHSRFR